jgi:multidrug transporter EmrE-like cation transporter
MIDLLLFGIYAIGSVASLMLIKHWLPEAQAALRIGNVFTMPGLFVCSGAFLYIVSFLVWMVILARNDLTVAYPIAISLTLLLSTLGAAMLLGEPVSAMRTAGIAIILAGIIVVVRS